MAKAASGSQAGQVVPRGAGSRQAAGPPSGSQGALRRRTTSTRGGGAGGLRQGVTNFYTDESPGIKVSPVAVMILSLGFIAFVTLLHIVGKLRGN
ncbi:hypothetical protein WJX77_008542 [Trebouxia sp. C0004]